MREQWCFLFSSFHIRAVIEHAFALLNGRFRKFKVQMDIDNNGDIPDIAKVACVMHNMTL
jgi:hypothetical protein